MYKLLVIVDAQNDFITGVLGTQEANAAVPNIINLIKDNKWDDIICTMDTHQDNYLNTLEGEKLPVKHCIDTEPGWCMDSRIPLMIEGCSDLIKCFGADENIYENGAFWYCNNHKVNIDTGAYASGSIVLLDLDTFDEHIFSV